MKEGHWCHAKPFNMLILCAGGGLQAGETYVRNARSISITLVHSWKVSHGVMRRGTAPSSTELEM